MNAGCGRIYRITVAGQLGPRFSAAFRGMTLETDGRETVLVGAIDDQAHLFGVLDRIQGLGLTLVAVEPARGLPEPPAAPLLPSNRSPDA